MPTFQRDTGATGGLTGGVPKVRIGTRGSRLALTQARYVADAIQQARPNLQTEIVIIQTTGDRILDSPLSRIGGKGVFTKEIEEALLDCRIDMAVHSLKDLPTTLPDGLMIGAVPPREDPADVLIASRELDWKELGAGAKIGTSSLRRSAQIRRLNREVEIAELRGNVPTRIQKVVEGRYDAIVLAAAGVNRLALEAPFRKSIAFDEMLPAPGQGAIALEVREDDASTRKLLLSIHDVPTAVCCRAERALLQGLGGGCQLPLGAHAEVQDGKLRLRGRILSLDGRRTLEDEITGEPEEAEALGMQLADRLLSSGARELLEELGLSSTSGFEEAVRRAKALDTLPLGGKTVIVTRDEDTDGPLSLSLRSLGAHPVCMPLIQHRSPQDPEPFNKTIESIDKYEWIIFTSYRAVHAVADALARKGRRLNELIGRIACVGKATAMAVEKAGGIVRLVPRNAQVTKLLVSLLKEETRPGTKMLYPRADLASPVFADELRKAGMVVDDPVAYRTERQSTSGEAADTLADLKPQAILFCSPSAVEALQQSLSKEELERVLAGVVVGSIGPRTSEALVKAGLHPDFEPEQRSFVGLARALADHFDPRVRV